MEHDHCLIVGLGNPGVEYEDTRHNLGFKVVKEFADKQGWAFKREAHVQGKVAQGRYAEKNIHLLLPSTYMNLSGIAVRKMLDKQRIPFHKEGRFLTVVDDVYVKFGAMRLREQGSPGGHNGLKSIEEHLHSQGYARLRLGVGPENSENLPNGRTMYLEDYVLGRFTKAEQEQLPQVVAHAVLVIECWLQEGLKAAIQVAGTLRAKGNTGNN